MAFRPLLRTKPAFSQKPSHLPICPLLGGEFIHTNWPKTLESTDGLFGRLGDPGHVALALLGLGGTVPGYHSHLEGTHSSETIIVTTITINAIYHHNQQLLAPQRRGVFRGPSNPIPSRLIAFEHLSLSVAVCDIRGATCIFDAVINHDDDVRRKEVRKV